MKTRSNMPLFVLEVSDVKALSNSQIDLLRCGDWLVKKDASGEHPYQVTFKKEGVGMCLTYHDASVIETQSYDWNNSLKKWVYNSEDKTPNLLELQNVEDAPSGTIADALGLDSEGNLVKGVISGGTKLYQHALSFNNVSSEGDKYNITFVSNSETPIANFNTLPFIIAILSASKGVSPHKTSYYFSKLTNQGGSWGFTGVKSQTVAEVSGVLLVENATLYSPANLTDTVTEL